MDYLYKLYYKDKKHYETIYQHRLFFETTLKTGLTIKPYQCEEQFSLYFVSNNETSVLMETVMQRDRQLVEHAASLPVVARMALLVDMISSELQSSNDLEGVRSSKEEIAVTTREILKKNQMGCDSRLSGMISSYRYLVDEQLKVPEDCKDVRKIYDEITRGEIISSDRPDGTYFRKDHVFVQNKRSVAFDVIYQGVVGEEQIEEHIRKLVAFMHREDIPLLLKTAICHYYFGYIHPFYDGNGRTGRFISSLLLRQQYSYLTAISLSQGCTLMKTDYYKIFDITNSQINKGELNLFVDTFLSLLIKGQEEAIENLVDKRRKLDRADGKIQEDPRCDTTLKKGLLDLLAQSYYFDHNYGIEREIIVQYANVDAPVHRIKRELKELEADGLIVAKKKRPLIYALSGDYFD